MIRTGPHRCLLLSVALALVATVEVWPALTQEPRHSISNFRAVNVSTAELQVTVDYTFGGAAGETEVAILATPGQRGGGSASHWIDLEELPVQRGTHSATLTIAKRQGAPEFSSESIRVCISTPETALLCEDFPYTKTWSDVTTPPAEAQEAFDVWDYSGYWMRSEAQQNYIVFLAITPVSHERMSVLAWGRCERKPEEGGTRADCEYWSGTEVEPTPAGTASLFHPLLRERWDLSLSNDGQRLNVKKRDGTGWTRDPGIDLVLKPFPRGDVCTVTGSFTGPHRRRANRVSFRAPSSGSEVRRAEAFGQFTVQLVEGTYTIVPTATGKLSIISNPRERKLRCRAGGRYQIEFEIVSVTS